MHLNTKKIAFAGVMLALTEVGIALGSVIETNIFNSVRDINLRTVMGYHKDGEYYNFLDDYDQRGNKGVDKEFCWQSFCLRINYMWFPMHLWDFIF